MGRKNKKCDNSSLIFEYICPVCNQKMYIPRRKSKANGNRSIRDLYCPKCKKKQKFIQGEQL